MRLKKNLLGCWVGGPSPATNYRTSSMVLKLVAKAVGINSDVHATVWVDISCEYGCYVVTAVLHTQSTYLILTGNIWLSERTL